MGAVPENTQNTSFIPSLEKLMPYSDLVNNLFAEYGDILVPRLVEYEVELSEFPVEVLNEIRAIYAGDIQNWSEVGGKNRIINPVTRLEGSGSQSMMQAFMGETPIGGKSLFSIFGGAIGFSFRYYLDDMVDNSGVKMLSINGVYPSRDNIRARTYPIIAQFYAIYRADNENENIPLLIDWILSEDGQALIEACGYTAIGES